MCYHKHFHWQCTFTGFGSCIRIGFYYSILNRSLKLLYYNLILPWQHFVVIVIVSDHYIQILTFLFNRIFTSILELYKYIFLYFFNFSFFWISSACVASILYIWRTLSFWSVYEFPISYIKIHELLYFGIFKQM